MQVSVARAGEHVGERADERVGERVEWSFMCVSA
jgi:hypothetical protein